MKNNDRIMCPSYRCKPGSQLLGIREESGMVAILPEVLPVDEEFIERAKQYPAPAEQRFRFTGKCIENGCKQWNGVGCGVADRVINFLHLIPGTTELPSCAIRTRCRWYLQSGIDACKICPYVLTEITEEELQEEAGNK